MSAFGMPLASALPQASELAINSAGLVDLDVTFFIQFFFFLALVVTLPKLIFNPLLERFTHRQDRTEGARSQAKAMLRDADKQIFVYEEATSKQKQKALAERAAARADAQQQAEGQPSNARTARCVATAAEQAACKTARDSPAAPGRLGLTPGQLVELVGNVLGAGRSIPGPLGEQPLD